MTEYEIALANARIGALEDILLCLLSVLVLWGVHRFRWQMLD